MGAAPPPRVHQVSVCLLTLNEADRVRRCLQSVAWADEIVVVDSGSTDRTPEVCREFTDRVLTRAWTGYNDQLAYALGQARHAWALCIDADEVCSPKLSEAVQRILAMPTIPWAGLVMPRRAYYLGRWIGHGGWYPDLQLRVVRRDQARCVGQDPHYKLAVDGPTKRLTHDLWHFTYRNFSEQVATIEEFSTVWAERVFRDGRRAGPLELLWRPPLKFLEVYVGKLGVLDGWPGLVIAGATAWSAFCRTVKLLERQRGA